VWTTPHVVFGVHALPSFALSTVGGFDDSAPASAGADGPLEPHAHTATASPAQRVPIAGI